MTDRTGTTGPADSADPPASGPPAGPPASGPPPVSVSLFLISLGRRARSRVEVALREHGIAYHHLSALGHLRRQPGLSYSELARRARVTVQSMQTTVTHLEQLGLVDRGVPTSRGRRAELQVTDHGVRVLSAAEAAIRALDEELLDGIGDRAALEAGLLRMFRSHVLDG